MIEEIHKLIDQSRQSAPHLPDRTLLNAVVVKMPWYATKRWPAGWGRDANGHARYELAWCLLDDPQPKDRGLIRFMIEQEIEHAAYVYNDSFQSVLMIGSLLLHRIGMAEDAILIWEAKGSSFDSEVFVDVECMVGAGVGATLAHLRGAASPMALDAAEYIESCRGHINSRDLKVWASDFERRLRDDHERPSPPQR